MEWLNIAATILTIITGIIAIYQFAKSKNKGGNETDPKPIKDPVRPPKMKGKVSAVAPPTVAGIQVFSGDDAGYQKWIAAHPQGFVVNTYTKPDPKYMPLHRATCGHISNFDAREKGAFTERDFIKVCSPGIGSLKEWTKANGRADGDFTGNCKCLSGLSATK